MEAIFALVTERPYVIAFLSVFCVVSWAEQGLLRTAFWLASGTFIGWLMEFSSTHNGFPFGSYTYNERRFEDEIWLGGVPLFASLSFAFLSYFACSAACSFLGRLEWKNGDVRRLTDPALEGSVRVLVLAAIIATWMDTVMDPVTHLGQHWFLGDLYTYEGGGLHFDVPLTNYAGWLLTVACIVFVNQRASALLPSGAGFHLPHKPFWALGTILGNFGFMIGVTVYLIAADAVPASEPIVEILVSALLITVAFIGFAAYMIARALQRERVLPTAAEPAYT
jgi:uncharacterized membrane protein